MKVRDVIRLLQRAGWQQVRMVGSHRQFKHPQKPGRVTVAGQSGKELPMGTLKSVFKQAGLEKP